jgi:hypothetical protein
MTMAGLRLAAAFVACICITAASANAYQDEVGASNAEDFSHTSSLGALDWMLSDATTDVKPVSSEKLASAASASSASAPAKPPKIGGYAGNKVLPPVKVAKHFHPIPVHAWFLLGCALVFMIVSSAASHFAPLPDDKPVQISKSDDLAPVEPSSDMLWGNFVQFTVDNVIIIMMAASCGLLGVSLLDPKHVTPMLTHVMGVGCNLVICCTLRFACLQIMSKSEKGGTACDIATHFAPECVWIVRVAGINFIAAFVNEMDTACAFEHDESVGAPTSGEAAGNALVMNSLFFLPLFLTVAYLGVVLSRRSDNAAPDASWTTFFIQALYVSLLSGSGKAGHILFRKATMGAWGPTDYHHSAHLQTHVTEVAMLTLVCVLGYYFVVPRLRASTPATYSEEDRKRESSIFDTAAYVLVYIWSFGFVNALWWFFYTYVGYRTSPMAGLIMFWAQLPIYLAIYYVFAMKCSPTYGFYSFDTTNYPWAETFSVFLYWVIDNTTWWGWYQTMVDIDTDADKHPLPGDPVTHSPKIIGLNVGMIVGIALLSCVVTHYNSEAMKRAGRARKIGGD